jgi:hypothetical protein
VSFENKPTRLSPEQEAEVFLSCFRVIDYVNDLAINIITNFIQNIPCPEAKRILLVRPEILSIGAFKKALNDLEVLATIQRAHTKMIAFN